MSENFPSLTKTWHSKPYDAISPSRAELSAKGKTVVITGGGGAIGGATALAFAGAGASKIVVIGRRAEPLEETKRKVEEAVSDCSVKVVQGDLADAVSMKNAFEKIAHEFGGKVDVLVANAGYLPSFGSIVEADPDEWFRGFEINGKGAFNLARAFLPHAADDAVIVYVSTAVVHMKGLPAASSYVASKLAADKIWEIFGVENPSLSVFHVHPGVVYSEINVKSGVVPLDDENLPGQFILWTASEEARPFKDKYLWCNWDVPELLERKDELTKPEKLVITMDGWPFPHEAPVGLQRA